MRPSASPARRHTLALLALGGVALSCHLPTSLATLPTARETASLPRDPVPMPAADLASSAAALDRDAVLVARVAKELRALRTGLPSRAVHRLARTLVAESRARDLDPELVLAVIEVESSFYNYAVSSAGAVGLMQVLPSTGEALAARLGIDWRGHETLLDPAENVRLGIAYLHELHARYGRLHAALAAYNWGPTRIDRRLGSGATLPERYVRKVLGAWTQRVERARS